jgi:hypothetical protein
MTVTEALELLEGTYVGEDIAKLQPKDRLNFWINLKEFNQPKIQRTMFEPQTDESVEIIITKKVVNEED